MWSEKSRVRRAEIRKNRPDTDWIDWEKCKQRGVPGSLGIAVAFFVMASSILMLRQEVVPYRPGQWLHHDIVSRVKFTYFSREKLEEKRRDAANRQPRIYSKNSKVENVWDEVYADLQRLPEQIVNAPPGALPPELSGFSSGAVTKLREYNTPERQDDYTRRILQFVKDLKDRTDSVGGRKWPLVVLVAPDRRKDFAQHRPIRLGGLGDIEPEYTYALGGDELRSVLNEIAGARADLSFPQALRVDVISYVLKRLQPNYEYNDEATTEARLRAAEDVPPSEGNINYSPDEVLVFKSTKRPLDQTGWELLRAEHQSYIDTLRTAKWKEPIGVAGIVFGVTAVLCFYIGFYQSRVVQNHTRAIAIAALLLAMLLLNQIAAIGNGPLYLFGTAPTLLVAMILAIGYDQRTAIGISGLHGLLATIALDQGIAFFIVIWVGVMTACFLLDDIRTRSKLIEVGGATAIAMAVITGASGLLAFDPWDYIEQNCLYSGASGLMVGFIVLGILPFVEKAFKITTSMTLLELADQSQPLLKRLQQEAQGTYNHSLQVGVIAEAAAESIGANALLCRVASYYHDVGKINKPEYFVENQAGGESRHINLSPNVSRMIIVGHVKDGIELAKEYNLPASIIAFIQQHHGTTLVEFFYRQARTQQGELDPDGPEIKDHDYRYEGPKPRTRETAIVMLADCVESACRSLEEPTASRVESLVHDLAMKRLVDGQFDGCDLTMRELEQVERSMIKTMLGIYHGRIAYPTDAEETPAAEVSDTRAPRSETGTA